jgi:hypothetical protein
MVIVVALAARALNIAAMRNPKIRPRVRHENTALRKTPEQSA